MDTWTASALCPTCAVAVVSRDIRDILCDVQHVLYEYLRAGRRTAVVPSAVVIAEHHVRATLCTVLHILAAVRAGHAHCMYSMYACGCRCCVHCL